jgi:uncharacterized membrane protein
MARLRALPVLWAALAVAVTMLALDLTWLGLVARSAYDALGALKAPQPNLLATALFYTFYLVAIIVYAVLPSPRVGQAARRGAGLGLVSYGTYELTNWAVLTGWPAGLVPIDIGWGVVLTATAAAVGSMVYLGLARGSTYRNPQ